MELAAALAMSRPFHANLQRYDTHMCGIVGLVSNSVRQDFQYAVDALAHRGPDHGSTEQFSLAERNVFLGHRRLSILDLSSHANQPFSSPSGDSVLIYNGEIYNHVALRDDLRRAGVSFRTRSDTEVILAGLDLYGRDFLQTLNGMFAFAFLDKERRRLLLARDIFGIKPLYMWQADDGSLAFASELRSIAVLAGKKLEPDTDSLAEFLLNGFIYEPNSGYEGVVKVPPGHAVEIDLVSMSMDHFRYHDPLAARAVPGSLAQVLTDQVALELESDVKTGLFFSGGVDSSVLAAAAPRGAVEAMYVEYGLEGVGDAPYVDAMARALGLPLRRVHHTEEELTAQAIVSEFDQVARGTEEPISDYTYIATRAISRHARDAGFKVMLSGMGGDELFAGYPRHVMASHWSSIRPLGSALSMFTGLLNQMPQWRKRSDRLASFLSSRNFGEAYTSLVGYFSRQEVTRILGSDRGCERFSERLDKLLEPVASATYLRQAMHLDRHGFLPHNLTVTDRASMAESIEVRVPLLNGRSEAYAGLLADSSLLRGRAGKLPLKRYLENHAPTQLVNRPKAGFNPPLDGRILRLGRGLCTELVCSQSMSRHVDTDYLSTMINAHFEGRRNNTYRIWQMIYLSLWLKNSTSEV